MTSSNSDSDSDGGTSTSATSHRHVDLSSTIFKSYIQLLPSTASPDLSKIQSFLTSSSSGALSCLICLERIKPSDPTWSCSSQCFSVFHLICIQSWSRQSVDLARSRSLTRSVNFPSFGSSNPLPDSATGRHSTHSSGNSVSNAVPAHGATRSGPSVVWNCPKCRAEYPEGEIPKYYYCFCGKERDPVSDPWVLPHSCGEICNRSLKYNCGHVCLLLCHPGPCPACPKLVKSSCFCGKKHEMKRCGLKEFSCNGICGKRLPCEIHFCGEICHAGLCSPCREVSVYKCKCGKVSEKRECCDSEFRCEGECGRVLRCGKHVCSRGCHEGECGECPQSGKSACPCGKRIYNDGMACDVLVPLCGATCDKMLNCGYHRCPERCHRGPCIETCRIVTTKLCRCGSLQKEVPCYQDLSCERKCQRLRDCGKHACRRRCCDGNCPSCTEVCGKTLRCRNHKCPAPCHRGACAPCPVMLTISCACGETHFEVPCGTEKEQKPPKCPKPCHISPLCRHSSIIKPHKCHYGACPPCRLICKEEYKCGHMCKLRCHGPKPPPNRDFTLKLKKKKSNYPTECTPGTPCPPCPELVWRQCIGQHLGAERMMVCSNRAQFSCDNLCGNLLPCGNHYCTNTCHALESQPSISGQLDRSLPCEECHLPCQKERSPTCPHPCPQPCHVGDCLPCKVLVKRSCHCGAMVHVFQCIYYNSLSAKDQLCVRSCGGPCHRKLPNCTHLCPEICHPGQCPSPDLCHKKVTVRCRCQTLKKEWLCQDVQVAYHKSDKDPKDIPKSQYGLGLLPCISDCKSKLKEVDSELQHHKPKILEAKDQEPEKQSRKQRKRRERGQEVKEISKLQKIIKTIQRVFLCIIILAALIAAAYYGYKVLFLISDWMNEIEQQKQRRRYPPR